jgi:hypothetical protein
MNAGQMLHDVREVVGQAVGPRVPIGFHGRMGGAFPMPEDVVAAARKLLQPEVLP